MSNIYLKLEHHNKRYTVVKSLHTLERREGHSQARDSELLKEDYKDILLLTLKYGLTSFRDRLVVVEFKDYSNRNYYILLTLVDQEITIVSTLRLPKTSKIRGYMTVNTRLNLTRYYTLSDTYQGKVVRIGTKIVKPKKVSKRITTLQIKKKNRVKVKTKDLTVEEFWALNGSDEELKVNYGHGV